MLRHYVAPAGEYTTTEHRAPVLDLFGVYLQPGS